MPLLQSSKKYHPLPSSESLTSGERDYDEHEKPTKPPKTITQRQASRAVIQILISLSLIANIISAGYWLNGHYYSSCTDRTEFAGLERNIARPWTLLGGANETEQDELWENTSYDVGQIALSDEYAKNMGLPRAQRFPWDYSKGVYLINSYHQLHCVKTLRQSIVALRTGAPQLVSWGHVNHCLKVLRDEIMCNADDVPRYTGFQPNQKSGLGQVRMCRDWNQLEAWAKDHTACWRHVGELSENGFRELDRYRFCPEGSPYEHQAQTSWLGHDEESE